MPRPKTKTNAQIKNDYARKVYDDIRLQVKKGRKELLQAHAEHQGESLNGFVNRAIDNQVKRDNEGERGSVPVKVGNTDAKGGE